MCLLKGITSLTVDRVCTHARTHARTHTHTQMTSLATTSKARWESDPCAEFTTNSDVLLILIAMPVRSSSFNDVDVMFYRILGHYVLNCQFV
jgi:hypothetical protein